MISRRFMLTLVAALMAAGIQTVSHSPAYAVTQITASLDFYNDLSPYGSWERVSRYGDCWVPLDVPVGWRPYTVGYWVDTDYGWMWISEDPWGGIPYHYGRWAFDSYYGWVWVPDDDLIWAPSWVAWRYGDDYVGWAPLPPDAGWGGSGLTINVSLLDRRISRSGWCFAPVRSFGTTRIRSYILPPSRNVTLLSRTQNVTRYESYNGLPAERGLRPELIERAAGHRFQRYQVMDSRSQRNLKNVAIQGRTIEVYRPRIMGVRSQRTKFVPRTGGPSRATIQRQGAEQRRFDQRMRQERGALEREHRREMSQQRGGARQDQMRQRQQDEMRAQQEREAQERRSLEGRRRLAGERQRERDQGQGQGQGRDQGQYRERGQDRGQEQNRGQGQDRGQGKGQDKGRGQGKDKGQGQDKNKGQDQSNDNGNGQSQDDQNKGHGRGHGR